MKKTLRNKLVEVEIDDNRLTVRTGLSSYGSVFVSEGVIKRIEYAVLYGAGFEKIVQMLREDGKGKTMPAKTTRLENIDNGQRLAVERFGDGSSVVYFNDQTYKFTAEDRKCVDEVCLMLIGGADREAIWAVLEMHRRRNRRKGSINVYIACDDLERFDEQALRKAVTSVVGDVSGLSIDVKVQS